MLAWVMLPFMYATRAGYDTAAQAGASRHRHTDALVLLEATETQGASSSSSSLRALGHLLAASQYHQQQGSCQQQHTVTRPMCCSSLSGTAPSSACTQPVMMEGRTPSRF